MLNILPLLMSSDNATDVYYRLHKAPGLSNKKNDNWRDQPEAARRAIPTGHMLNMSVTCLQR